MMTRSNRGGFTLLELLVVVIIIGILATVALPQFGKAADRAREAEAQNVIAAALTAEFAYFQEKGTFTSVNGDLLVTIPVMKNWTIAAPDTGTIGKVTFTATSSGHGHTAASDHTVIGTIDSTGVRTFTGSRP